MICMICRKEGAKPQRHLMPNGTFRTLVLDEKCHSRVHDAIQVMVVVNMIPER